MARALTLRGSWVETVMVMGGLLSCDSAPFRCHYHRRGFSTLSVYLSQALSSVSMRSGQILGDLIRYAAKDRGRLASMADDKLLKVSEVADRLRVRQETVRRWLKEGKLRGTLLGGSRSGYRIPESEVERLLKQ
jgi:excisionase family DNA binding protein